MKFRQRIQSLDSTIMHIPAGFKRYGSIMVVRSSHRLSPELGQAAMQAYPWCKSVYQHVTTTGEGRHPKLLHLAGAKNTQVIHQENGVRYALDISHTTFSGGNRGLRERMVEIVQDGEMIVDMFAAVGNLSLQPLVYNDISAVLIEQDRLTFEYLQHSLRLNKLSPAIALHSDCRQVGHDDILLGINSQQHDKGVKVSRFVGADRILMGYHGVDESHLQAALSLANSNCYLHLHPLAKPNHWDQWLDYYREVLLNEGCKIKEQVVTKVKNYSPGLEHVEFILHIQK